MIIDALKVMLFGMFGIFFVMGLIIVSIYILNLFQKKEADEIHQDDSDE